MDKRTFNKLVENLTKATKDRHSKNPERSLVFYYVDIVVDADSSLRKKHGMSDQEITRLRSQILKKLGLK